MSDIVLFGPPGCGKGTQAKRLRGYRHVSTGDLFRSAVAGRTELGKQVEDILGDGNLIPDEITLKLVEGVYEGSQYVVWDGFPRTVVQAEALDRMLFRTPRRIGYVVNLVVPDNVLLERIIGRFKTSGRDDDNPETFGVRLATYERVSKPVLTYYEGRVVTIDGCQSPDAIAKELAALIAL